MKEKRGVTWADYIDQHKQNDRKQAEYSSGEASLRSAGAHLPFNADSFPNDLSGAVENFSQVAARLFLDEDRGNQKLQVTRRHARAHLQ
jgi:hypothetical protein